MIRNQWYAILESKALRKGKIVAVKRLGEPLVLWRQADGRVSCLQDKCVHRGAALSIGKIEAGCIECPFHGLRYDCSGQCLIIPANGAKTPVPEYFKVKAYPVCEAHDFIWIFWGDRTTDLPQLPFFENLTGKWHYLGIQSQWSVHYTRCIENQLDVVHLPFVHRSTIGKGNKTIVNGPVIQVKDFEIKLWTFNDRDTGQAPLKSEEIPLPEDPRQHVHFRFPNLWQNWLSPKLAIFISFTPIDDSNTLLYVRTYQNMVTLPVIRTLFSKILLFYSQIILNQDRRVVITQDPKKSALKMDERLILGDLPIIKYREIRERLIKAETASPLKK